MVIGPPALEVKTPGKNLLVRRGNIHLYSELKNRNKRIKKIKTSKDLKIRILLLAGTLSENNQSDSIPGGTLKKSEKGFTL